MSSASHPSSSLLLLQRRPHSLVDLGLPVWNFQRRPLLQQIWDCHNLEQETKSIILSQCSIAILLPDQSLAAFQAASASLPDTFITHTPNVWPNSLQLP